MYIRENTKTYFSYITNCTYAEFRRLLKIEFQVILAPLCMMREIATFKNMMQLYVRKWHAIFQCLS